MTSIPQLVVGTAGHIDHGKSRLVFLLTGTDPDRLPEEKARGMTIDLGFAHAQIDGCEVWFVDVPGHERFVRHMVAGATGVDLALLAVAADDAVMPQTREHVELLSLLGIERCIVALTKMDLVDDEWAGQVEEETRELLAQHGVRPIACVRTSAETGRGVDELRRCLADEARQGRTEATPYTWFRLPIDRAFSVPGRGTVVTGSVTHGAVAREEELEMWPAGRRVRVRDLQSHHDERAAVAGRMRLAANLAGVTLDDVQRGCELATPGYLRATRCLDVHLIAVRMPGKTPRQRLRLRLHIATGEVLAELRLLEPPTGPSAINVFGQLLVVSPIVATWGQRFILRDESGQSTLGGGRVIRPVARPWRASAPARRETLEALLSPEPAVRLEAVLHASGWQSFADAHVAALAGLPDAERVAALRGELQRNGRVAALETGGGVAWLHRDHLDDLARSVAARLAAHLDESPRSPGVPQREWSAWMPKACPERLRPVLADWVVRHGTVELADGYILPQGRAAALSPQDRALLDEALREFCEGGFRPPAIEELRCRTPRNARRLGELLELATARGQVVRCKNGVWLHGDRWDELVAAVTNAIRTRGPLTVSDIRTITDSSRKYVVPIVEQLDAAGVTKRVGDQRTLGPAAPDPARGSAAE